mmetsp:Transcript_4319/g.12604  ORF Transcript_4319/g.12604 Transcript_4319/m.12604 type:complete len:229 (-) Transcript_4319:619-1305(-)
MPPGASRRAPTPASCSAGSPGSWSSAAARRRTPARSTDGSPRLCSRSRGSGASSPRPTRSWRRARAGARAWPASWRGTAWRRRAAWSRAAPRPRPRRRARPPGSRGRRRRASRSATGRAASAARPRCSAGARPRTRPARSSSRPSESRRASSRRRLARWPSTPMPCRCRDRRSDLLGIRSLRCASARPYARGRVRRRNGKRSEISCYHSCRAPRSCCCRLHATRCLWR